MWFGLLAIIVGCNAEHFKTAVPQEKPSVSVPSPTDSVAEFKQKLVARHHDEDRLWADRTNLTPEQVRYLRLMSDVPDDEEAYIDNLDTENLKKLNHVLLVTASGNGHCLELTVFERERDEFQRVWSTDGTPSGAGFCRESPRDPEAFASTDGRIVVKIPIFDYNKRTDKSTDIYTYVWTGKKYDFLGKNG
jgi:hypothetical protein